MKSHSYAETSDVLDSPSRSSNGKGFLYHSNDVSAGSALRLLSMQERFALSPSIWVFCKATFSFLKRIETNSDCEYMIVNLITVHITLS